MQATEALRHIHAKNVIHCDFGCHNFLTQKGGALALSGFGGSTIDSSTSQVGYATRYQRPCSMAERSANSTRKDDLFALGTVLYEITAGARIFDDVPSREIRRKFEKHEYPDLSKIPATLRTVIEKCRAYQYETVDDILLDLQKPAVPS
ncbi:hypothetical protein AJ80_02762 [Polytolypa hystricis UAMH7299]|uniref:Protein kinase domain-containing protein n=1 Tax=Polytolypa hystricis (strain UAMH7299) TaxID=1447883 RepID=A0A2B7YQJ8_POLH7|nr:hypothetical protein AJ80_02762 [Polytolypa hystricis UAMH7299]